MNTSNSRSKVNVNQHGRGSSYSRKPNQTKQSTSRSSKISAKLPHSLLQVNELEDSDADQPPSSLDYDTGSDTSNDRPCVKCEGVIDDFTKAISCEFCAAWVCLHCSGLPERMYDMMLDEEVSNVLWTCDSCVHALPTIKKLGKTLQGVRDEQDSCKSEIGKLNTKVEKLENSIDTKVQEAIEEYREREARKYNVIIHNIPESKKEDSKDRISEDMESVDSMLEDGLDVSDVTVTSAVRLGKREEGKTRLLKVGVDSVKSKRNLLQNARKLRRTEAWKKVFITPDHTPKERQVNRELREELKRRSEEGEERLVIRKGKIVQIPERDVDEEQSARPALSQSFRK